MIELLVATKNNGKLKEIEKLFQDFPFPIKMYCLTDLGIDADCPETGRTFHENAKAKALFYGTNFPHMYTVGDDSGLSVEALDGAPGVYSARFSGPDSTDERNIAKLLHELKDISNPKAKFVTVLCLCKDNTVIEYFQGEVEGVIITEKRGSNGFGYDPVFYYPPLQKTFAELSTQEKNRISHRSRAFQQLKEFIELKIKD